MLRQSLSFFQNDFAGRIAQKVLQSGPALRESVVNVVEGIFTLVIYLVGTIALFVGLDAWLILPVALWAVAYGVTIYWMVPPVRAKSEAMAEANSGLSGRIVDSYTNIQAVKLFAHAEREEAFAQGRLRPPCRGVPRPRRRDHDDDGLAQRHQQRPHLRDRGTVDLAVVGRGDQRRRDRHGERAGDPAQPDVGLDSPHHHLAVREHRDARERDRDDQPAAGDRRPAGREAARGDRGRHPLRGRPLPLRSRGRRHRGPVALDRARARRSGWSAAPAPASRRWSTCSSASTTSRAAAS